MKKFLKTSPFCKPLYNRYLKCKDALYYRKKRKTIQHNGFALLHEMHTVLSNAGVVYFVDFGTLLGIIRSQGFLKHDLDVDIGVLADEPGSVDKIQRLLMKRGCALKYEYVYDGKTVEQSYLYKGIKFDICYYGACGGHSLCYLFYRDPTEAPALDDSLMNVVCMRYTKIEGVETHTVGGVEFHIPKNAHRLLEEKYGPDWRIPNKNWIYWKSPSATKCSGFGKVKKFI